MEYDPGNGITAGYRGDNETIIQAMTAFAAISWANAIELIILIFLIFRKYTGVYFWSLLISSISIIPYTIGAWMKQVELPYAIPALLPVAFLNISWLALVPGQSLVLWSRLHLITHNQTLLRLVLRLIIVNWFLFCVPTTVLTWASNVRMGHYVAGYTIVEKIQMTAFSIQEIFISGIYVWEVRKMLSYISERGSRKTMWELLGINIFIIILDVILLTVEFLDLYQIETTFKGMVYSVKLKLEFGVLSKLVKVALGRKCPPARIQSHDSVSLDMEAPVSFQGGGRSAEDNMNQELTARKASVQHIQNVAQDFNLSKQWNHSIPVRHGSSNGVQADALKVNTTKERPGMYARNSERSSYTMEYPGRLDTFSG